MGSFAGTLMSLLLVILLGGADGAVRGGVIRPLGGYERLLSRKTSGSSSLSLSHGCAFIFNEQLQEPLLLEAVACTIARHPILRARIDSSSEIGGGTPNWVNCYEDEATLARRIVRTALISHGQFALAWKNALEKSLNKAFFPDAGPLWSLDHLKSDSQSALVFTFNHATDDQRSLNILVKDLMHEYRHKQQQQDSSSSSLAALPFPPSMEEAVAPGGPTLNTLLWALFQLFNAVRGPSMIPNQILQHAEKRSSSGVAYANPDSRSTFVEPFTLSHEVATALRRACKARNNTVTSVLAAAMLCVTAAALQRVDESESVTTNNRDLLLRFLLSVDLRPYGASAGTEGSDWTHGTVACAAGAVDFNVPVSADVAAYGVPRAASALASLSMPEKLLMRENLWNLAARCRNDAQEVIQYSKFVPESVRLFGLGMRFADVLQVVELDAKSSASLGRGYSCGVSNMGFVPFDDEAPTPGVSQVFYGTSHSRNGVLCQLSCMTTGAPGKEDFCGCLQFTDPIITREQGVEVRQALSDLLTDLSES